MRTVIVRNIPIGKGHPLVLISGPCVIESESAALYAAEFLKNLCYELDIPLIYKSSYDKANRSSFHSFRGPGIQEGLKILEKVKAAFDLPILSDVHTPEEAAAATGILDVIQIPAFLCRQTDLVTACGLTGAVINAKKGQFMAPWDMKNVVEKIEATGNHQIILTERGGTFGYNNLVADMRSIPWMQKFGYPVCFDGTHSVQLPGGLGTASSGQREMIPTLSKAAIAAGAEVIFLESHPNPSVAKSDAMSVLAFSELKSLLKVLKSLHEVVSQDLIHVS
jgi:2-dehydro-3-deoxyphosphooctonate aldolase (KDO 8-P synthase)